MMKYGSNGNEYRPAVLKNGQKFYWQQVLGEEGEQFDGELRVIDESSLFDVPPQRKLNDHIADLHRTEVGLREQIQGLQNEIESFETAHAERLSKFKTHKGLERIEDFLEGRITHFVVKTYGPPKILTFANALESVESYDHHKLKLLTLFGRNDGAMNWGINAYKDGSGYSTEAIPFTSHDSALHAAQEMFEEHTRKAIGRDLSAHPDRRWITQAADYGIAIDPEYVAIVERAELAARARDIAGLESKLEKLREVQTQ